MAVYTTGGSTYVYGTTPNYQLPFSQQHGADFALAEGTITPGRITGGGGLKARVVIVNPDVLQEISVAANRTYDFVARQAAIQALDLYETAEQLLAEEVKGKIRIEVQPYGEGEYIVQSNVLIEPKTRRPRDNAVISVSNTSDRVVRSNRYKNVREVGSITTYVAQKMHIAFAEAEAKVQARGSEAVERYIQQAFRAFGVKHRGGSYFAPAGGIEYGGQFYGGGRKISI